MIFKNKLKRYCLILTGLWIFSFQLYAERPNILIIAVDDLRPELNCYGAEHIHSPYIDRLAEQGMLFQNAYCQYALCGPSRTSLFTGLRPDTLGAYGNSAHFRNQLPEHISLPQYFKEHGYATYGFGKILHNTQRDEVSWTEPQWYMKEYQYANAPYKDKQALIDGIHPENREVPLWERAEVGDEAYRDGLANMAAIEKLREIAQDEQPFLLFVGYHKPHTPFNAPAKYWDLYDAETLPMAPSPERPEGSPDYAWYDSSYVRSFKDMPESVVLSEEQARTIRHAYFACVSYIDQLVGDLLEALEVTGEADNTVIALFSDHGYQLGDHGMWSKHTNFETSTRIPFILYDPRIDNSGETTARVELIDLYPTLLELAGLSAYAPLEGRSLKPLLKDETAWDDRNSLAYSQFRRGGYHGYSVRSERFRYTEWRNRDTGEVSTIELYDHSIDPHESKNRASEEKYEAHITRMRGYLAEL